MTQHNVLALIDLPHNTFRPFNNAKCVAIIFQKNRPQQEHITMVAAEEMGHNHQGKPLFRYNHVTHSVSEELWDDLALALDEVRGRRAAEYTFAVSAEQVRAEGIYIPRYYWPHLTQNLELETTVDVEWKTIRDFIGSGAVKQRAGHGSPPAQYKGKGQYPYIRVKDIINWEIYRDPNAQIPRVEFERLTRKYPLLFEDVVYVSRGSYRIGDVAIVGPDDENVALTREIQVLRVIKNNKIGLSPYYLLYLLSHVVVAKQTKARVFMDTTLPNIGERYLDIKLPWSVDAKERERISEKVRIVLAGKWSAMANVRSLLSEIRKPLAGDPESLLEDEVAQ